MNIATRLPWWFRPGDPRSQRQIEDDIRAELQFHFDELVDSLQTQGLTADEAHHIATERFGDLDSYVDSCQRIKTGDRIVLQRILLAVSATLVVLVIALAWQLFGLSNRQTEMVARLEQAQQKLAELEVLQRATPQPAPPVPVRTSTIIGTVRDNESKPIAGAHVLAIYKTWPGGRYQQRAFATMTSDDGGYKLPAALETGGKHALQIAFAADGYCLESRYLLDPGEGREQIAPQDATLVPADPVEIELVDADGNPAAGTTVVLTDRRAADGHEAFVYHQASEPLYQTTDDRGRVTLRHFATGDTVSGSVHPPGESWRPIEFTLTSDEKPLVVQVPAPFDPFGGVEE